MAATRPFKPPVPAPRSIYDVPSVERDSERPPLPIRPRSRAEPSPRNVETTSQLDSLRDFSTRKGFTEHEFREAIRRTTLPVETNYFLAQLLAVKAEGTEADVIEPRARRELVRRNVDAGLKNIVIDGSNIAMKHGKGIFSCSGIQIAVDYFRQRGHPSIKVFVPDHRKDVTKGNRDVDILHELEAQGFLIFTPSRERVNGTRMTCYDDRFILKCACKEKAVVVSNDHYRDLIGEEIAYRDTVTQRLLPYTFDEDRFMPAEDPMGKRGLTLDQFLRVNPLDAKTGLCPYGRKCTYGTKCKYAHTDRDDSAMLDDVEVRKRRQQDQQRQEFLQRAQRQDNNNTKVNSLLLNQQRAMSPVAYVPPYTRDSFSNHPSHLGTMPRLVSRGIGESTPAPQPPARNVGPQRIVLKIDNTPALPTSEHCDGAIPSYSQQSRPSYSKQYEDHYRREQLPNCQTTTLQKLRPPIQNENFISQSDPRYKTYFHLKGLFSEETVREAMTLHPSETDPQKLFPVIMELSASRNHDGSNI